MKVFNNKHIILLLGLFGLFACKNIHETSNNPVAEVGNKRLYSSDLSEILPNNISKEDSTVLAEEYIRKWVKQELLIKKANENLSAEQKDVSKELNDYRNSLIIYKYKNELLKQRLDTVVSEEELEKHYLANPENFKLGVSIVKAVYVKTPQEVADPELLKTLYADLNEESLNELLEYCHRYAKGFDLFVDSWVDFELVKRNIPLEVDSDEAFLTSNSLIELNDSNYYYLVGILDYKLKNDLAPMEYVENNIRNLILNQRKIAFLREIEENLFREGIKNKTFKIFNEVN